jgi:peptidoglycan/xylan/chitin deacetylase (PgdA/CDA1 family)
VNRLSALDRTGIKVFAALQGGFSGGNRLLVLHYHRVAALPDALFPEHLSPQLFDAHLAVLQDAFTPLPLGEALARLTRGELPRRAVSITFDDGYADNHDVALPILQRRGLVATFYIATRYLQGGAMFNDAIIEAMRDVEGDLDWNDLGLGRHRIDSTATRRAAIEAVLQVTKYAEPTRRTELVAAVRERCRQPNTPNLMMNESQVRALSDAGMEIGAHTVTHPILLRLDSNAAAREIAQSRADLEAIVGDRVKTFAYPNGKPGVDYDARHAVQARAAGFTHALTTSWGCIHAGSDAYQLPRIAPWDSTARRFAARLALSYRNSQPSVAREMC